MFTMFGLILMGVLLVIIVAVFMNDKDEKVTSELNAEDLRFNKQKERAEKKAEKSVVVNSDAEVS